jgi:hypothetical protein
VAGGMFQNENQLVVIFDQQLFLLLMMMAATVVDNINNCYQQWALN